jgi:hypothetical protein
MKYHYQIKQPLSILGLLQNQNEMVNEEATQAAKAAAIAALGTPPMFDVDAVAMPVRPVLKADPTPQNEALYQAAVAKWQTDSQAEIDAAKTKHAAAIAEWSVKAQAAADKVATVYYTHPEVVSIDAPLADTSGKVWTWDGSKAVQVIDLRGTYFDKAIGVQVQHTVLGALPSSLTATAPPDDTSSWSASAGKWVTDPAKVQAKQVAQAKALQVALGAAIQRLLDATAQARGYDHMLSLCSYAESTNARFKAEALAGMAWRDAVWAKAGQVLDQVQAGTRAVPTEAELLGQLPAISWPV